MAALDRLRCLTWLRRVLWNAMTPALRDELVAMSASSMMIDAFATRNEDEVAQFNMRN